MIELQRLGTVGRFSVEFDVSNYADVQEVRRGLLAPEKVRRARISGVVDTGASNLVLPVAIVKQLGLPKFTRMKVRYANNRRVTRDIVIDAFVELLGRGGMFKAVAEPNREDALIGAIVLEDLDLLPDCNARRLVPRDPKILLGEIE